VGRAGADRRRSGDHDPARDRAVAELRGADAERRLRVGPVRP
jgi:hypothetical protein